jgi:peptidoglycan-associated lipoprotein
MRRRFLIGLTLILVIPGLMCMASCAKKTNRVPVGMGDMAGSSVMAPTEEECPPEGTKEMVIADAPAIMPIAGEDGFVNEDIYFDYDQAVITPASQAILKKKAAFLRKNPGVTVTVEGHCDERGTNEYNLALGERRARSAKTFLADMGVAAKRLSTISYGEERPLDPGHNEPAWRKNRRGHFVIK